MDDYPHSNPNWLPYYQHPPPSSASSASLPRSSSGLSLSISTLSVTSSNGGFSPVTPLSPAGFRYAPPDLAPAPNDDKSVPRKRSLTASSMPMSLDVSVEEEFDDEPFMQRQSSPVGYSPGGYGQSSPLYEQAYEQLSQSQHSTSQSQSHSTSQHSPASPCSADDEFRMRTDDELLPKTSAASTSTDEFRIIESHAGNGGVHGVLGKTPNNGGTNNFVSKLYAMINDSKSAQFISWKEDGSSFIVSNVGEFSRSILGSHFKHNNFSSFVRQLNMYGFHKINRTPRTSRPPLQTWEFSHPRFIRGRPDLLDDIKRKALVDGVLSPNPNNSSSTAFGGIYGGVSGEDVLRKLEDNKKALKAEREKVEKLVGVVRMLWEVMERAMPGSMPLPFPAELLDAEHNPPILITTHSDEEEADDSSQSQSQPQTQCQPPAQPQQSQQQQPQQLSPPHLRYNANISLQSSPCSSPTTGEFPHLHSHPPPISVTIPSQSQYTQPHQSHPHSHLPPPPQISYPSSPTDPGHLHPLHGHNGDMHSHHAHTHAHAHTHTHNELHPHSHQDLHPHPHSHQDLHPHSHQDLHPHSHQDLHPHSLSQQPDLHQHHNTAGPAPKRQRLRSDSAPLRSGMDASEAGGSGSGGTLGWINHSAAAGGGVYQMARGMGRPRSGSNLVGGTSGGMRGNAGVWYGGGSGMGVVKDESR